MTLHQSDLPGYLLVSQGPAQVAGGQQSPSTWDVVYRRPDTSASSTRVIESIVAVFTSDQAAALALHGIAQDESAASAVELSVPPLGPGVSEAASWKEGPAAGGTIVRIAAVRDRVLIVVGVLSDRLDAASAAAQASTSMLLDRTTRGT